MSTQYRRCKKSTKSELISFRAYERHKRRISRKEYNKSMKCAVTGVAGFIGSHLADYLIEQGHEVIGIDNFMTGDRKNINPKVEFHKQDILSDKIFLSLQGVDWVFHLAANARTFLSVEDPWFDMKNNIEGTLNVLCAARDNNVKRFIYASSCILYSPNTPYYVSKQAGESYTSVFGKIYPPFSTIALRYSNVYGSLRQSEKGSHINALASLRKTKRDTGRIWITGDGTQTRQWSHVKDICRANLLAAQSKESGVFDICTGVNTTMNEVANYFQCPIDYVDPAIGDNHDLSIHQDPEPAFQKLGYRSEIPFGYDSIKVYL